MFVGHGPRRGDSAPIETLTYYARALGALGGGHELSLEVTGSDANSAKSFSNAQLTANTTNLAIAYPLNPSTAATYNAVYNAIFAAFTNPAQRTALQAAMASRSRIAGAASSAGRANM